jgi:hypothetical protein
LYSIYKHHVPKIRRAVNQIFDSVGRVLPATKITATALRIANANKNVRVFSVPDVATFSEAMNAKPASELRINLDALLPVGEEVGKLFQSFEIVKRLLVHSDATSEFWIPEVLLASFSAELWQVLVFWASSSFEVADWQASQQDVVRFALYWHLCVWNDNKAATQCFQFLAGEHHSAFPGKSMYHVLIGADNGEPCAIALAPTSKFTSFRLDETPNWRTDAERFGREESRNHLAAHWWWSGVRLSPWLQKEYIRRKFESYAPLTNHEDDLPYDVDHICAKNDWNNFSSVRGRFGETVSNQARQFMQTRRWLLGDGIGNKRLVESIDNREDQDDDIACKMPFILLDKHTSADRRIMKDFAFAPEDESLYYWKGVSRPRTKMKDRIWDEKRLGAFQQAVELRAAELYTKFYNNLQYKIWVEP